MRVVFMGTPSFAVPTLRALVAGHEVAGVYTRPDSPSGRGRTLKPSAVKNAAMAEGLRVLQPSSLRDPAAIAEFVSLEADVCVVAAYGAILPCDVLDAPPLGCVNLHASLLPRWRGAAPVQRAILAGDETTGVSVMLMEEGLDTGPFAEQVRVEVDGLSAEALTEAMAEVAPQALLRVLEAMAAGTAAWTAQDESRATYATKVTAADVSLSPRLDTTTASRRVRASGRSAPARCEIAGTCVTIGRVTTATGESADIVAGQVLATRRELLLGFADGVLAVDRLTPQGRSEMDGASFGRGLHVTDDLTWGACS